MTQSLSRQLAQWVHGLRFEDLPPAVVNRACAATLQGLTSALVGSQFPDAQQALAIMKDDGAGPGNTSVLGPLYASYIVDKFDIAVGTVAVYFHSMIV